MIILLINTSCQNVDMEILLYLKEILVWEVLFSTICINIKYVFLLCFFLSLSLMWTCGFALIHPGRIRRKPVVVTCEGPSPPPSVGQLLLDSSASPHTMRTPHGPNSKFNSVCVITLPLSLPSFLPSCRPVDEGQMGQMSDDSIRREKSQTVLADSFCLRWKYLLLFFSWRSAQECNT